VSGFSADHNNRFAGKIRAKSATSAKSYSGNVALIIDVVAMQRTNREKARQRSSAAAAADFGQQPELFAVAR
jgi:hypothetical protein